MSVTEAAARVADEPIAREATTDGTGNATMAPLRVGLYYVQESITPAGYVAAAPFLVALPLTDPEHLDTWLTTVHIYPKNASASIKLDVVDRDSVAFGDRVHWTSRSNAPLGVAIDGYRVDNVIVEGLELVGQAGLDAAVRVALDCEGCPELVPGIDFTVVFSPDARTLTVEFLQPGLSKLEATASATLGAQVIIGYDTVVLTEGEHANEAILLPSRAAIESGIGIRDTAVTKWGPTSVLVHEHGNPANPIAGARFELFLTEEDALAGRNQIVVDGISEWTTDEQGRLVIQGLRFSNLVNGLDREPGDPLYRPYWAAPAHVPSDWRWVDDSPLAGAVTDAVEYQTLIFTVERGSGLPRTGAQLAGVGILGALLLLGAGVTLTSHRRRRGESTATQ